MQNLRSDLGHHCSGYLKLPDITPGWMNTVIRIVASSANSKNIRYNELHEACVIQEGKVFSCAKSAPTPFASAFSALRQNLSELWIVFVFLDMVSVDMPGSTVSTLYRILVLPMLHLCRLSGRGYLCSLSGQNGQI